MGASRFLYLPVQVGFALLLLSGIAFAQFNEIAGQWTGTYSIQTNISGGSGSLSLSLEGGRICDPRLNANSASFGSKGGSGLVRVTSDGFTGYDGTFNIHPTGCESSSGRVYYISESSNLWRMEFEFTCNGAQRNLFITQATVSGLTLSSPATKISFVNAGYVNSGVSSLTRPSIPTCPWSATSTASWITITSGANGDWNGEVSYAVAENTGLSRTGTILIAGQIFTISQAGVAPGNLRWTCNLGTGTSAYSCAAIGTDGIIYVAAGGGKLCAINPDGSMRWTYTSNGMFTESPAIGSNGIIYIGADNNRLYAINPDGTQKWVYFVGGDVLTTPAIGPDGTIYVGNLSSDMLQAVNPNGTIKWKYYSVRYASSSPIIGSNGVIYIGSEDYNLHAVNPNGRLKWKYPTGGRILSTPAISTNGVIYFGSTDKKLYALNPDGSLRWTYETGSSIRSSPAIGLDGTIYFGSNDKNLYALNPDGSLKWKYLTGNLIILGYLGSMSSSPAIGSDGVIYIGGIDGKMHAVNPDGTRKWTYATYSPIYDSPAIAPNGFIYFGSTASPGLLAVHSSSLGLAKSAWPMFHHDALLTGLASKKRYISPHILRLLHSN